MTSQKQRAETFQALHQAPHLFALPNVWDPGSAVIAQQIGFESIATTSAGVAFTFGYPDGQHLPVAELTRWVGAMVRRISIPLSVDMERGYAEDVSGVRSHVRSVIRAGAVGINLEDGIPGARPRLDDLELCREKIQGLTQLKTEMDIPFVINARTCAFLLGIGAPEERLALAIDRCNAFAQAGADCVFVPGLTRESDIDTLVKHVDAPVNLLLHPHTADLARMDALGVRRLSLGSAAVRAVQAHLMAMMHQLKNNNDPRPFLDHDLDYARANAIFTRSVED